MRDMENIDPKMGSRVNVGFSLNGEMVYLKVNAWDSALTVLREQLRLTGTKEGCGIGECGACTIIVDGNAVNSCLMLAPQLHGTTVETVEGLGSRDTLHPLQEAFLTHGAVQCGFCTPGMLMSAEALLEKTAHPTREEIIEALSGNLCRCTGYEQIIEAVQRVARRRSPRSETVG